MKTERQKYFEELSAEFERLEYEHLDRAFHATLGVPFTPSTPERIEVLKNAFVITFRPRA